MHALARAHTPHTPHTQSCGIYSPLPLCAVSLQALPKGNKKENNFTYFQIETGQNQAPITNKEGTLGLYVNRNDWLVKATKNKALWDKFKITIFVTPVPVSRL